MFLYIFSLKTKSNRKFRLLFVLFACLILLECGSKLIGAGGLLESATNSRKTLYSLVNAHSDNESRNALGVSMASARVLCADDNAVLDLNVDAARANARGFVGELIHNCLLKYSFNFNFSDTVLSANRNRSRSQADFAEAASRML